MSEARHFLDFRYITGILGFWGCGFRVLGVWKRGLGFRITGFCCWVGVATSGRGVVLSWSRLASHTTELPRLYSARAGRSSKRICRNCRLFRFNSGRLAPYLLESVGLHP